MSMWVLIVAASAGGAAVLVWHAVSKTKHASDEMLKKYTEMLEQARKDKAEQLAREAAEAAKKQSEQPPVTQVAPSASPPTPTTPAD
jgi:endonuclease IV